MSGREIAAVVPLTLGVLGALLGTVGMARLRDSFARLHMPGFVGIVGPIGVAIALAVTGVKSSIMWRAVLVAGLVLVTGPILTHVTARAEKRRRDEAASHEREVKLR